MTSTLGRGGAALALAALAALAGAGPAQAADEITIDHVAVADGKATLVVSVDQLPDPAAVDASTIDVEVDGRAVESSAKTVAAGDVERSTVLVLDASNSMQKGGRFVAATGAVDTFLSGTPADVEVGLVTFAGDVRDVLPPSTDHEAISTTLDAIELTGGTGVYDAIIQGIELAGLEGSRSVLVLSDGADTASAATLEVVTGAAEEAGVVVDIVSLATRADELTGLAEATGGRVIPADPAALDAAFAAQADALASQLVVTFDVPEWAEEEASIDVTVPAGDASYQDDVFAAVGEAAGAPVDVVESGRALVSKPMMLAGAVALALGLAGLLLTVLGSAVDSRSGTQRRLDSYLESGQGKSAKRSKQAKGTDLRGSAVAITDKVMTQDFESKVSMRLSGAGSSLAASEWILLHAGIAVGAGFVLFFLGGTAMGFLGLLLGAILPWFYLRWRHGRRLNAFNAQLAQTLGLMAGGLQAGLSLPQAVDSVVREGHEPMAGELRRALVEQRLGVDITDALEGVGVRMKSEDFAWIVMAIRIQREVGGNLAEILHTVADTLREREYLRRQVKALSAEGRLSGYILSGLPILVGLYMSFANPEYASLLYTTVPGFIILGIAAFLLVLGSFAMAKLAKVEV